MTFREADFSAWWEDFDSPELNTFIRQALAENQNIVQAVYRVTQAQTQIVGTQSTRLPQINLEGDMGYNLEGSNRDRSDGRIGGALDWEIDAFNRIGAAVEADRLEALSLAEDLKTLRLSISADVATSYFGAVAAQNALDLLNQQVTIDKDLLELLELRFQKGVGTRVEVMQQKSRVADSESLIPIAQADLRVNENHLDVLLGRMPDGKNRVPKTAVLEFNETLPQVGVPADLLLNRPDLRAARASLLAADFDIGSAIADRLPRLTLSGSTVYADTPSETGIISFIMAKFVQPLLDWGRRKAEVERNKALYQERLAAFTQKYLNAVESVENALYQEHRQKEFIKRLGVRLEYLQATLDETEARYTQGVDDYLPVLNALQELRQVERNLVLERLALANFRISLHRAVGGSLGHIKKETEK